MKFKIKSIHFGKIVVIIPEVFEDERGFFIEVFKANEFQTLGLPSVFVQDNHSKSVKNVLRGLHFQWNPPMGKLMRVTYGSAFLVAVDIRKGSPTLGKWFGTEVTAQNKKQIWAPAGFARGFCVLSDYAEIQYKCTGIYNKNCESGILWCDPDIGIKWPIKNPIVSEKDARAQTLTDWFKKPESENFKQIKQTKNQQRGYL
ncbi:MAG: dTDP-4-dehydrorhamnose 3,5-epimerase [Omnitrophica bacterium]|nr:dTDP-4-dehydrorhamnose 3,5-epimerase [Candidatus Omnitrophota bacterium]